MNTENQKCVGVVFSNRAIQDIKTETYDKDPVETGGLLLGYVLESGHWVVVEIIPPGDNSTHRYAYLEYDESLAQRVVNQIADKYEQKLELLGLWHRHPGSMDFFSGTDDGTNITFAELNPSYGAISGLVNIDPKFRMTMYHVDSPLNYTKVETFVGDDIIPENLLKLKPGVTFEEIDAIKNPKMRQEQPSASQPLSPSQPQQQATPRREEPRQTTQNREHHEKPQVIIQSPDTVTGIFKKLVLEHTKAFCGLVAVFFIVIGIVFWLTSENAEYKKHIQPLHVEYQEFLKKNASPEINDLSMYIDKFNALKLKLKDQANKDKIEEIVKEITGKKTEIEKSAEADKITKLYTEYQDEKSLTSKILEDYIRRFNILKLNLTYEENKKKIDEITGRIETRYQTVKKEEDQLASIKAKQKANAQTAEATQKEYIDKIKPWYEKYKKGPDKIKNVQNCLNNLNLLKVELKHDANKTKLEEIIGVIDAQKTALEQRQQQQENAKKEKEKNINKEYNDAINIPCNKTIEALEQCIEKLNGLKLDYQENEQPRKDKVKDLEKQKQELLKKKQEEDDKKFLETNEAYKYFQKAQIDSKNHEKHLKSLESIQDKLQSTNYKNAVEKLINDNNPDKLSDILNNDKTQCKAKCATYKKLKSINRDKDKDVLNKFKETCKEECK